MTPESRSYGGESAEQRSERRRALLLEAALDLVAEKGAKAVSKRGVCARANLNDRYFYEHFADRDALLNTLIQKVTAEGVTVTMAAAARPDIGLREQIHAGISAGIGFLVTDPRRGRLLLESYAVDVLHRARTTNTRSLAAAAVSMIQGRLRPEVPRDDVLMVAYAAASGGLELVAAWLRGELDTSREHLTDIVADIVAVNLRISWIDVEL
jgi:AcrR family transcriptional regulator